jgi:hypothetical protein
MVNQVLSDHGIGTEAIEEHGGPRSKQLFQCPIVVLWVRELGFRTAPGHGGEVYPKGNDDSFVCGSAKMRM